MKKITSTKLQNNFGKFVALLQKDKRIAITQRGKVLGVTLMPEYYLKLIKYYSENTKNKKMN